MLLVIGLTRSRAGFFRIDSAFPASAPGRHHIGPFGACSSFTRVTACQVARPPFCGLCREVPAQPVSQPNRSPAIESNRQLFEWVLPPLVICPFRAHAEAWPHPPAQPNSTRSGVLKSRPSRQECLRHENGFITNSTTSGVLEVGQASTACPTFRTPDVVEFGMNPFSWRRHSCLLGRDSGLLRSWN